MIYLSELCNTYTATILQCKQTVSEKFKLVSVLL